MDVNCPSKLSKAVNTAAKKWHLYTLNNFSQFAKSDLIITLMTETLVSAAMLDRVYNWMGDHLGKALC